MRVIHLLLLILFLPLHAVAQLYAMRDTVPDAYNFWLYLPDNIQPRDSSTRSMPLILFLHGQSLCGNDLARVRRYGCLHALAMGCDIPTTIIAPQNRGGRWNPQRLHNIIEWACNHYAIDTTRIYVIGMSLGGFGAIDYATAYPDETAACMALCGGASTRSLRGLEKVPIWIIHGTADRAVPIESSRRVVRAIEHIDTISRVRFTELPGADHGAPARIFYLGSTYKWLLRHTLRDSLRRVDTSINIGLSDLSHAYDDLRGKSRTLSVVDNYTTATSTTDSSSTSYHTVHRGDTLSSIAKRYHTSIQQLCSLNGISRNSILHIGQRIKLQ
jgi:LysM repeat protein